MFEAVWQFTPYVVPVLVGALVASFLAILAWRQRGSSSGSRIFIALLAVTALWSYTYALELSTTDADVMLLWVKFEWIGIALLPVAWFLFALYFTGRGRWVNLRNMLLLSLLPVIMMFLAWATPSHSLLYLDPGVTTDGPFVAFSATRGRAFWVHVLYSYILLFISAAYVFSHWRRSRGRERQLVIIVLIGFMLPFASNAVYLIGLLLSNNYWIDLTLLAFAASTVLFYYGWSRLGLSELVPRLSSELNLALDASPARISLTNQERALNRASLALLIAVVFALVPIVSALSAAVATPWFVAGLYVLSLVSVVVVAALRRLPFRLRASLFATVFLALALLEIWQNGLTYVAGMLLAAFVVACGILLDNPGTIVAMLIAGLTLLVTNDRQIVTPDEDFTYLIYQLLMVVVAFGPLLAALYSLRRDNVTLYQGYQTLSQQLEVQRDTLEVRVRDRTHALETSAAVSRRLSTIFDRSQLIREVIEQLRVAFSYYHVHVYLWNEDRTRLELVGGTGDIGRKLLVVGHGLAAGQGLVGRAAATNQSVVVPDVTQDDGWLSNPLLPDTKAEIAVPITHANEVLGVLDAQDRTVNNLGPDDARLLESIAGQLAAALHNARLVNQIQKQAEQEALINAINRRIAQTDDISSAVRVAILELSRALQVDAVDIQLQVDSAEQGNGQP